MAHFDTEDNATICSIVLVHGGGTRPWTSLLGERERLVRRMAEETYSPTAVIGGGFTGVGPGNVAAHKITGEVEADSIVEGADSIKYLSVEEIMADPNLVIS